MAAIAEECDEDEHRVGAADLAEHGFDLFGEDHHEDAESPSEGEGEDQEPVEGLAVHIPDG
jgi:hypothetical protein